MGRKNNRKPEPRKRLPTVWEVRNNKRTGSGPKYYKSEKQTELEAEKPNLPAADVAEDVMANNIHPKRMEIWFARLDLKEDSSIQGGDRPVLIISNNGNNDASSTVTILPMTSKKKKPDMAAHTWLDKDMLDGLDRSSMVLAEQITTIDKKQLIKKIGYCDDKEVHQKIARSIMIQLGMEEEQYE